MYVVSVVNKHICFPDAAEQARHKVKFYYYGNFGGAIYCMDKCCVETKCQSNPDAAECRNHKKCLSVNPYAVCTLDLEFSHLLPVGKELHSQSCFWNNCSLCADIDPPLSAVWDHLLVPVHPWARVCRPG